MDEDTRRVMAQSRFIGFLQGIMRDHGRISAREWNEALEFADPDVDNVIPINFRHAEE
jgi:hypothetical protein